VAQRARANHGEFAQAVLRMGLAAFLMTAYFPWVDWGPHTWVPFVYWGFVAYSVSLFVWIYSSKTTPLWVRYFTPVCDMGAATALLGLSGDRNAIMLFIYTWIALGHGFRFGLRYLRFAWMAGLVCIVAVYVLSAAVEGFWYRYPLVWLGVFVWVVAPTFYITYLIKQMAARAQEEARVQVERAQAEVERERVERARAEAERARHEAEAASEAKSEFLATMSHEMRTPLNGVVGAAELLTATDLPQRERQLVDWLLISSRQLRSLIDNLLDLRKIESGKMTIDRAPFDLHVLMNRVAAMFEADAKRSHLRFTRCISASTPYLLVGDSARIQQVLINLVGNALKFTPKGFVRVSVGASEETEKQVTLRFEVRDTGIGISSENAGRIFDRFQQADSSIHKQYGGSGLGTAISKGLIELMGGAIGFDSAPGDGTTFWFTVPMARPPAEAYDESAAVSIRGSHLYLVSGRPGQAAWLAGTARERQLQMSSFRTVAEAASYARERTSRGPSLFLVEGEDDGNSWRDAPEFLRREGILFPSVLLHSGADEAEAFDAGYVSLLKWREPALIARIVRSVVAGSSSMEPVADFSGQEASRGQGRRVLVAEDNQISQQIIAMMLQAGGHTVTLVGDGDSVLDRYRESDFDVVILDMHMPGRTGLEVARAIRTLETAGGARRMPIIMLTAAASTDLREDSLDAGVDLFLSKPVDPRALLRGVNHVSLVPERTRHATLPSSGACVDRALLQDMAELARDPAFLETLFRKFSTEAGQLLDLIEEAVAEGDRGRFRELTHALKGTAMMAGAIRLRDSVARAETIADPDFAGAGGDSIREMRAALEATSRELSLMVA
jgi:two-component system sensor histidine kinase RpfC